MAPSLVAAVSASPFLLAGSGSSRRPLGPAPTRRAGLRVAALKYDPAKVGGFAAVIMRSGFESSRSFGWNSWYKLTVWCLFFWGQVTPQNDRVLVRLQQIPEVSPLSIVSLYRSYFVLFRFVCC